MTSPYVPPEPCAWCGWVRGEHASSCALNKYLLEQAANLEFPPGPFEPAPEREPQPPIDAPEREPEWRDCPTKLDCPE